MNTTLQIDTELIDSIINEDTEEAYKRLPPLNNEYIKTLIKSEEEVDAFIASEKAKPEDVAFSVSTIVDFMGKDFMRATTQPQHYCLGYVLTYEERIYYYYYKIFKEYNGFVYNSIDSVPTHFADDRKNFIYSNSRRLNQFKQMLWQRDINEQDFWNKYSRTVRKYQLELTARFYHTQREIPVTQARVLAVIAYAKWADNYVAEIINEEFTFSDRYAVGGI